MSSKGLAKSLVWIGALLAVGGVGFALTLMLDREEPKQARRERENRGDHRERSFSHRSNPGSRTPPERPSPPDDSRTSELRAALGHTVPDEQARSHSDETLTKSIVETAVHLRLEELDVQDGALVNVACEAERCLAEIRGPQLRSDFPKALAADLSESVGIEHDYAATLHFRVAPNSGPPVHVTFASFFPDGGSKKDAREDVKEALEAFQSDMEADD